MDHFQSTVIPKTPTLSANPGDSSIQSSTRVTLTCLTDSILTSSNVLAVTYSFYKNNNLIYTAPVNSDSYTIASAATSDNGVYSCVASISGVGSTQSSGYTLTIVGKCQKASFILAFCTENP